MCGQRLPGDRMMYCAGVLWKLTKAHVETTSSSQRVIKTQTHTRCRTLSHLCVLGPSHWWRRAHRLLRAKTNTFLNIFGFLDFPLDPRKKYHIKLLAYNAIGDGYQADQTISTPGCVCESIFRFRQHQQRLKNNDFLSALLSCQRSTRASSSSSAQRVR